MTENSTYFGSVPFSPLLLVISGPSGIGKDAVVQALRTRYSNQHFVITMTSRPPRPCEKNGVDYFFVSREEFERLVDAGELLEHAKVYSDYKGIPRRQVKEALESGKDVIMRLDVQGAMTIRSLCPEAVLIFLTASSREEWINRLASRCSESPEEFELRVRTAEQEFSHLDIFDYIVVNAENKLEQTVDIIQDIITAEHHRVHPRQVTL